ncbi:hypothetical protein ACPA9J_00100 [Pseudomonas aeruginosa]
MAAATTWKTPAPEGGMQPARRQRRRRCRFKSCRNSPSSASPATPWSAIGVSPPKKDVFDRGLAAIALRSPPRKPSAMVLQLLDRGARARAGKRVPFEHYRVVFKPGISPSTWVSHASRLEITGFQDCSPAP